VIKPLELDIYVPKNSLGIELNGLYWHSSAHDFERGRHAKKAKVATQNNIKLLAFYEDEVLSKIELIESMILSKCGLSPYKVGARKLSLKEVSLQNAKVFFEENHLDGSVQCSLALGLYDNKNNLLACMSFRQYAGSKYKYMEIARFAVSKFCSIPGAASRLIRHSGFKELVSYSNNRCSDGNLYRSMGFIEDTASTQPSYWYTDLNNRYFRTMCRKIDTGIEETEEQQAARGLLGQKILGKSVPMFRIEDYGHRRWILTK
jgi:hypothetical protein